MATETKTKTYEPTNPANEKLARALECEPALRDEATLIRARLTNAYHGAGLTVGLANRLLDETQAFLAALDEQAPAPSSPPTPAARMTDRQRAQWAAGKTWMSATAFLCDTCTAPAVAIGHAGEGAPVRVECGPCFLVRLNAERAVRPTRAQMVERVNATIREPDYGGAFDGFHVSSDADGGL